MIVSEVAQGLPVGESFEFHAREPRPFGMVLAVLVIAIGVAGIVGNLIQFDRLRAPFDGWPRMQMWPSIEHTLIGASFLTLLRAEKSVTLPLATIASILGVAGILSALGAFDLPWGGVALSSAVLYSTLAFAFTLVCRSNSPRVEQRAFGISGFVVITLVVTMFGATAIGVVDPLTDTRVAGSSLQALICSLAIGAYLLAVLWSSGRVTIESADWLPAGVGFASILTVLVLWRALSVRETEQLTGITQQAGEAQVRAIKSSLLNVAQALSRAAERRTPGESADQQVRDLRSLQRDLYGVESGAFISTDSVHPIVATTDAVVPALDSIWRIRMRGAATLRNAVQYWPLDSGATRFVVVSPSCTSGKCAGAVAGVIRTENLLLSVVDTTLGFYHRFESGNRSLRQAAPATVTDSKAVTVPLDLGDVHLQLTTWPTQSTVRRVRSQLPLVALLMGAVVSALLVATTLLGQGARRLARTREKARLASVLERSTDGIWEWDLTTGAAEHSAGIWQNLGYDEAANAGKDAWMTLVHPDDLDAFSRSIERHLAGDTEAFEQEYRVRSKNGDWHTMVDRARVVERSPTGQPVRLLGVRADVTETRNAHSARLLNERRFRAIFDSGFQYQLLLDHDGLVLEVNRVALESSGDALANVVGKPVWSTLWWACTEEAREPLREAVMSAARGIAARYEADLHGETGPTSMLEIAVKPFLDQEGQANQLLLEARDITVRRRAEAALAEVDTLTTMGRVAARVAHEINNPLAGIQNSFLLIKGAIPVTHPHYAYVGAIEREIDRIAAVTRQLYETYRPEQDLGGGTSVRSLVTDAVAFLGQVNRGTQVRVETDFTNVPSVIRLPSAMLRQIFYNLAQNAIEASPAGGVVNVRTSVTASTFELSVRDRGQGVPAALRDRIFDPFFSTKDRGVRVGGMG
ncbi:MAG: PAS domain S-box protein, partial [Gemmatimonadota bacterium]|nr:PAS domain S-box protein [Gemmatimonadota bacterium]